MKIITISALTAISAVCVAQDFDSDQSKPKFQFDSPLLEKLQSGQRLPSDIRLKFSASDIQLRIPDRYSDESRNRINELIGELRLLCPDCSTGGTVGGVTIIGGGTKPPVNPLFPVGNQLFPTNSEQVLINKSELAELRRKAAMFDLIEAGRGNE